MLLRFIALAMVILTFIMFFSYLTKPLERTDDLYDALLLLLACSGALWLFFVV